MRPLAFHQRRWEDGRTLLKSQLGDAVLQAFGFPYDQVHRGDLLTMLTTALPQERVHAGHKLTAFADSSDRVTMQFENGAEASADIMIGADGIHSAVRRALFGEEQPRYTAASRRRDCAAAVKTGSLMGRRSTPAHCASHRGAAPAGAGTPQLISNAALGNIPGIGIGR